MFLGNQFIVKYYPIYYNILHKINGPYFSRPIQFAPIEKFSVLRIFSLSLDTQSSNGSKSFNDDSPRELGVLRQEMQAMDDEEQKIYLKHFLYSVPVCWSPIEPFD